MFFLSFILTKERAVVKMKKMKRRLPYENQVKNIIDSRLAILYKILMVIRKEHASTGLSSLGSGYRTFLILPKIVHLVLQTALKRESIMPKLYSYSSFRFAALKICEEKGNLGGKLSLKKKKNCYPIASLAIFCKTYKIGMKAFAEQV